MANVQTIAACLLLACSTEAYATEGAVYGGPIGGTDIRNAYLPGLAGFYGAVADVPGISTSYAGNSGAPSRTVTRLNLSYNAIAASLLYVYPFKLFGGTLGTDVQLVYEPLYRFSANNVTQDVGGWGDMYADLVKWSYYLGKRAVPPSGGRPLPYGVTIEPTFSMIFPIGTYDTHHITTTGHNDYFVIPNFGISYLTHPNFLGDGLEVSGRLFYDHAYTNPATDYTSGDIVDLDYAVTERAGRLQYGIAGFGATQDGRDIRYGLTVPTRGKYTVVVKAGPVAEYDLLKLGLSLKAKLALPIYARNSTKGPQFVFVAGFKF